jgi:hypothetical protein
MTKTQRNYNGPVLALSSAFLFGASTPIAKLLLGVTDPLLLAGCFISAPAPASHWFQRRTSITATSTSTRETTKRPEPGQSK